MIFCPGCAGVILVRQAGHVACGGPPDLEKCHLDTKRRGHKGLEVTAAVGGWTRALSARDRAPGGGSGLSQRWHLILEEETSRSRCLSCDKGGSVQAQETPSWPVWACSISLISLPQVVPEGLVVPRLGWVHVTTSQCSGAFSTKGRQAHRGK